MYCRKCGSLIEEGAKFCENCGAPIPAGASMAEGTGGSGGNHAAEGTGGFADASSHSNPSDSGGKFSGGRKTLIIILIAVIAAVCGGLAAFIANPGYSAEYKDKLEEAQKYVSNEDYDNAELTYKGLIELEPKEERAYFELSDLYVEQTRYDEAIDTLELGKTNTGDSDKFDKKIRKVKASMGKGKGKATESKKTGDAQILKLYSDHMSGIFQDFKYLDSVTNIDAAQQTYVYDPNDDKIPDVLAYSYLDHNEDYSYDISHNGFCAVDNGKLVNVPIEGTLSGMAVIESRILYATPDRTVYLWDSSSIGNATNNINISIKKYELKAGKYKESILEQDSLPYEEVEDMFSNINEYIPADAEQLNINPASPHITTAWNHTIDETARLLSMFDISILPAGTWGKDWKKAYQDYFGKLQKNIDDSPDNASVQMASEDVNGDGIPEIFLNFNYNSGTLNGGSLQCYTFANGRVVPFPTRTGDIKDVTELFPGGRDIRIDKKEKKIYYDGITGGYGNDQLQYICHVGHNGFVIDESFESKQELWVDTLKLVTTHNFQDLDGEEMSSIFSNETFNGKTQLNWQDVAGKDTLSFIKNL